MKMRSLLSLSIAGLLSAPVYATTVTGKVTDTAGQPVAGAEVKIEGSRRVAYTDANGIYRFDDVKQPHIHLHVYSSNYIHGDNDLGDVNTDQNVDFVLKPASVENIVVTANALQSSVLESVTPVTVIGAEKLRKIEAPTLGETLKNAPGVHSTYFGPVSSSPVIRGNDGPRVKIVQNGLDVSDVSRVGPDHNVATTLSSATQVEVLRGPATLQYGSGAIGGVVNVVDKRIPQYQIDGVEGEAETSYSTVNNGSYTRADVTGGSGNIAWHVDGFYRDTDNADIPGFASIDPDEDEPNGVLESSAMETRNVVAGLSYVAEEGYFGFAVEQLDNKYGVPGYSHAHGEEEHEGEDHDLEEHDHEEHAEEGVLLDVDMTRYQAAGEWHSPFEGITNLKFAAAYTDYEHAEIEDGEPGTVFTNESSDIRLSAYHEEVNGWHGVFGLQFNHSDYNAVGEEAFTPANTTSSYALYLIEQKKVGNVTFELGGRLERTTLDADASEVELDVLHDEHEGEEHAVAFNFPDYDFTSLSLSAGANWEYQEGHSVAVTLSRSERAPSQQELFSAGQHLATQSYEVGLVFDMDEEGHIEETLKGVKEEVSTNLDITFRKFTGSWGYSASFFYNQADDYIFQTSTGLIALSEHEEHGHDEHGDEEGLPIYYFQQADADIWGFEAETYVDLSDTLRLTVFGDYIRAEIEDDNLPRTPPMRFGSELSYVNDGLSADVGFTWYDDQNEVASFETATDGYTLVNASVQYEFGTQGIDWVVFARGENLTDEEARVHTSFLKDQAPLPGRNFTMGVRALF
ncbi:TonB-dependent receptor [Alteromonas sp. DY56-G5]|jgi:iron complex outermembrane receptor protein|uniref:TonB-dependent receptor n=1 Tax=Alteromonas TaxID=226 RepID=UPI0007767CA4|nr:MULTISPECIES: TonB-dependent receptor [Alteromonas]AMN10646.1 TonB-dependent receptor [Alteromonas macleodii]MDM7962533.1 TonB-dependent receptor [Alteromonas macleodii]MDM8171111.1 TonB-dependent receptor [Alteromonas macleodii]NOH57738.1 TonB-dependent receptor [Alteromonas sp. 07-89-2]CAI3933880.1 iron complex outermembrane receptor protein [Alteromonas macleodii]